MRAMRNNMKKKKRLQWSPDMVGKFEYCHYWDSVSLIIEVKMYPNGYVEYVKVMDQDGRVRVHCTALDERDRIFSLV
jgi:hypothetical protein